MYSFLKGTLFESSPAFCVLDVQGVGFKVYISLNTYSKLPQTGKVLTLFTSFVVREQSHALYGFLTTKERDLFEVLINVSGIGPKLALSLIGHMTFEDLSNAVTKADAKSISKVPGIGKKTAERLIVEMRDKLGVKTTLLPMSTKAADLSSALVNLGYSQAVADKATIKTLEKNPDEENFSQLIRHALTIV
ncbi:MAG: Holliday junction branch migration protein RuvA [Chlamydiia bacterium]|nr:Holliday junction branch migration protein RuvA [Chlamydiia bacterium]